MCDRESRIKSRCSCQDMGCPSDTLKQGRCFNFDKCAHASRLNLVYPGLAYEPCFSYHRDNIPNEQMTKKQMSHNNQLMAQKMLRNYIVANSPTVVDNKGLNSPQSVLDYPGQLSM